MTDPKLPTPEHPPAGAAGSTRRTMFEGRESSSLQSPLFPSVPPKVKMHFGGVGFLYAGGGKEGGLGTSEGSTGTLLHLTPLFLPLQRFSPSHPGGCHLPLVLQPLGSLHQHLRGGR